MAASELITVYSEVWEMADWSALPMMLLLFMAFLADLLAMVGLAVLVAAVVVAVVLPAGRWCSGGCAADNAGDNGVKAAI